MSKRMQKYTVYFNDKLLYTTFREAGTRISEILKSITIVPAIPLNKEELLDRIMQPLPPMRVCRNTCGACAHFKHITKDTDPVEWNKMGCYNSAAPFYKVLIGIHTSKCEFYEETKVLPVEFYLD